MTSASFHQQLPISTRVLYITILAAILAILLGTIVVRGIQSNLDSSHTTTPVVTQDTSPGATKATGAPTTNTNTPSDRTVPSPTGSGANSLLRHE